MLDLVVPPVGSESGPAMMITPEGASSAEQPKLVLHSRVPGRERWYINLLEDNPRLAAGLELVLRGEEGIEAVHANPLTGRILVRFQPDLVTIPIEVLLRQVLAFGPMSPEEFSSLQLEKSSPFPMGHLLVAEIGCSAVKMALFGSCCPAVLAGAGILFLLHRRD